MVCLYLIRVIYLFREQIHFRYDEDSDFHLSCKTDPVSVCKLMFSFYDTKSLEFQKNVDVI